MSFRRQVKRGKRCLRCNHEYRKHGDGWCGGRCGCPRMCWTPEDVAHMVTAALENKDKRSPNAIAYEELEKRYSGIEEV